jgi:hypothetical protein
MADTYCIMWSSNEKTSRDSVTGRPSGDRIARSPEFYGIAIITTRVADFY